MALNTNQISVILISLFSISTIILTVMDPQLNKKVQIYMKEK